MNIPFLSTRLTHGTFVFLTEREIIYPWTREGLVCRQVRAWN